jgi:hypothetical protein
VAEGEGEEVLKCESAKVREWGMGGRDGSGQWQREREKKF